MNKYLLLFLKRATDRYLLSGKGPFLLLLILLTGFGTVAQSPLRISLISDQQRAGGSGLDSLLTDELTILLGTRFQLSIEPIYTGAEELAIAGAFESAYQSSDLVITSGLAASRYASNQSSFPKPTIAAAVLGDELSGGPAGTGIENFTFVRAPFDVARDLQTLQTLSSYERLTLLGTPDLGPIVTDLARQTGIEVTPVFARSDAAATLAEIPSGTTALYLTPVSEALPLSEQQILLDSLSQRMALDQVEVNQTKTQVVSGRYQL